MDKNKSPEDNLLNVKPLKLFFFWGYSENQVVSTLSQHNLSTINYSKPLYFPQMSIPWVVDHGLHKDFMHGLCQQKYWLPSPRKTKLLEWKTVLCSDLKHTRLWKSGTFSCFSWELWSLLNASSTHFSFCCIWGHPGRSLIFLNNRYWYMGRHMLLIRY